MNVSHTKTDLAPYTLLDLEDTLIALDRVFTRSGCSKLEAFCYSSNE